jgi:SAM-dependent methyltransferase
VAIGAVDYLFFRSMRGQNALPDNGDVLEVGEANWYGDVDVQRLRDDINLFVPEQSREATSRQLDEIVQAKRPSQPFEIAKIFWQVFVQPKTMTAIDFKGSEKALKLDLNDPIDLQRQFDIVVNIGTIEHVFNVAQALKTIHDHTRPGGLMLHVAPFTGWMDHGFYNFNPTIFWDLARANDYHILVALYAELAPVKIVQLHDREQILAMAQNGQIGTNTMIYVTLRKPAKEMPFQVPIQGYYAGAISRDAAKAWSSLRAI